MDTIALYYPHTHVRDDTWLKYAALYWPKMGRFRPDGYPLVDSAVAEQLHAARWLMDITPPKWAWDEVGQPFLALINEHAPRLRDRFGLDRVDTWGAPPQEAAFGYAGDTLSVEPGDTVPPEEVTWLNPRFGFVHASKIGPDVVAAAVDAGLAITGRGRGGTWVGMHPELASAYSCALTDRVATEDRLHPVTDQELTHNALSGWTLEHLVRLLVGQEPAPPRPHLEDAFVLLAFETVVPADLEKVPVEKILEIRAKFGAELDAFRDYVAEQVQRLAGLDDVRDLPVFREYLHSEVHKTVHAQLNQLREQLRSIGVESARALANVKSFALPPLIALVAESVGIPPTVTVPAAVAACVVGAPGQWREQRRAAIQESPVGYLFHLHRTLTPPKLIDRLRRTWPGR